MHSPPLGVAIKYELGPEGFIPTETTDPNTKPPAKDSKSPGPAKPADSKPDAPNQGATKPAVGPAKTPEKASKP
jgi:hypothetical protein